MNNFFLYLLEISLLLAVLFGGYFFILRQKASPAFNRFYLLLSLLLAFIVPCISIPAEFVYAEALLPATKDWIVLLPELVTGGSHKEAPLTLWAFISGLSWLPYLYFTGFLLSLGATFYRLSQLFRLISRFTFQKPNSEPYKLANTEGLYPTFSFLNYIFWDNTAKLQQQESRQVLQHEIAHVKQLHSLDILLLELLIALLWFNPFVYWFKSALREVHEYLADRHAVAGSETAAYLKLMVKESFRQANLPIVSSFFQHNTLKRIRMLQSKPNKTTIRAIFSLSIAFTLFLAVACEEEPKVKENLEIEEEMEAPLADNTVFEVVEDMPTPKGGMEALYKTIGKELRYPEAAKAKGIEGKVFVQFVLEKDGKLTDVQAVKGLGEGLDEAAIEAIKATSGDWNPGRQRGQAVRTRMIMPILFKLD